MTPDTIAMYRVRCARGRPNISATDLIELLDCLVELTAYRESALYDALMNGPAFKGWNRSALDRARRITEKRLAGDPL